MHDLCMATKTISLKIAAYEKLKRAKRSPDESFSQVVLRGMWPEEPKTAGEFLEACRRRESVLSLEDIDRSKSQDAPPVDKWRT